MAGIVQATVPTPFEVSFGNTGLFVRATVFSMSTGSPVVIATVNMVETPSTPGSYGAVYTFAAVGPYMVTKRVYTDGTYSTLSTFFAPGSEAFNAILLTNSGGGGGTGCIITASVVQERVNVAISNLSTPSVLSTESEQILVQENEDEILV
jgi:hypothetical protein